MNAVVLICFRVLTLSTQQKAGKNYSTTRKNFSVMVTSGSRRLLQTCKQIICTDKIDMLICVVMLRLQVYIGQAFVVMSFWDDLLLSRLQGHAADCVQIFSEQKDAILQILPYPILLLLPMELRLSANSCKSSICRLVHDLVKFYCSSFHKVEVTSLVPFLLCCLSQTWQVSLSIL